MQFLHMPEEKINKNITLQLYFWTKTKNKNKQKKNQKTKKHFSPNKISMKLNRRKICANGYLKIDTNIWFWIIKGVLHPRALFLKTLSIFSKK